MADLENTGIKMLCARCQLGSSLKAVISPSPAMGRSRRNEKPTFFSQTVSSLTSLISAAPARTITGMSKMRCSMIAESSLRIWADSP